ncbi:MAG: zinc ribbon domain-containing protein [Methanomassiliicoccales archaeon]
MLKQILMKVVSVWMVLSSLYLVAFCFIMVFFDHKLGTIAGVVLLLIIALVAIWQATGFRSAWSAQVGEWSALLRGLVFGLLAWLVLGLVNNSWFDTTGPTLMALITLACIGAVFVSKSIFLPSKEEVAIALRKFAPKTVTVASECPTCHREVQDDWSLCPECGTGLPRECASCHAEVHGGDHTCRACGCEIEIPISIAKTVEMLKETAELQASPETRSARYARYADAQLKAGDSKGAVESYRKAIHYTEFKKKQTNFMVKMARVLSNSGCRQDAEQMLDAALQLDPQDWAGAARVRDEMKKTLA